MKQCCKNCHFLAKVHIWRNGEERRSSWTPEERSNFSLRHKELSAECAKGIWSTRIDPHLTAGLKEILSIPRKDDCFFLEIHEGMSFPAGSELQRLRQDNRQLKRSYRYTQIGLWIAAVGVATNVIMRIFEKLGWIPR